MPGPRIWPHKLFYWHKNWIIIKWSNPLEDVSLQTDIIYVTALCNVNNREGMAENKS